MADNNCLSSYLCGTEIAAAIKDNCENPMFGGIEEVGYIINKNAVEIVWDAQYKNVIAGINFKEIDQDTQLPIGIFPFVQTRNDPFTGTNTALNVNDYRNDFTRTISGYVPDDGAFVAENILDPLANGKFIVILKNQWTREVATPGADGYFDGENVWQVYGAQKGLKVSSMSENPYENNGYWLVELQESNVAKSGIFYAPLTNYQLQPTFAVERSIPEYLTMVTSFIESLVCGKGR